MHGRLVDLRVTFHIFYYIKYFHIFYISRCSKKGGSYLSMSATHAIGLFNATSFGQSERILSMVCTLSTTHSLTETSRCFFSALSHLEMDEKFFPRCIIVISGRVCTFILTQLFILRIIDLSALVERDQIYLNPLALSCALCEI